MPSDWYWHIEDIFFQYTNTIKNDFRIKFEILNSVLLCSSFDSISLFLDVKLFKYFNKVVNVYLYRRPHTNVTV